jgi:hypothetical protein
LGKVGKKDDVVGSFGKIGNKDDVEGTNRDVE